MPNPSSKDTNLLLLELELVAKNRGIKHYQRMPKYKLLSIRK